MERISVYFQRFLCIFNILEEFVSMKIWPKLGQGPISTLDMLLLLGPKEFLAKGSTLEVILALGQEHIFCRNFNNDFSQIFDILVIFQDFASHKSGQILANINFLGQILSKMKTRVFFFWPGNKFKHKGIILADIRVVKSQFCEIIENH